MASEERRRDERLPARLRVTLLVGGGGKTIQGISADLSLSGILVHVPELLAVGQRVDLVIEDEQTNELVLVGGTVVHVIGSTGLGIQFKTMSEVSRQRITALLQALRIL